MKCGNTPTRLRRRISTGSMPNSRCALDELLEHPIVDLGAQAAVCALLVLVGQHGSYPVADTADRVRPDDLGERVPVVADPELDVGAVVVEVVDVDGGEDTLAGHGEADVVVAIGPVVVAVGHVVHAV